MADEDDELEEDAEEDDAPPDFDGDEEDEEGEEGAPKKFNKIKFFITALDRGLPIF